MQNRFDCAVPLVARVRFGWLAAACDGWILRQKGRARTCLQVFSTPTMLCVMQQQHIWGVVMHYDACAELSHDTPSLHFCACSLDASEAPPLLVRARAACYLLELSATDSDVDHARVLLGCTSYK